MAEHAETPNQQKERSTLSLDEAASLLSEARARWDRAYEKERDNIAAAYEDLEFLANVDDCQWDAESKKQRMAEGRPVLTANQLPQFVHQVTGDIRQMKPAIKVVPVDDGADEQVADIKGGLIRYIENRSDAPGVYFKSADSQVAAGIGHWRILTEYADSSTFNQEIRIADIDDGVAVLWDPDAKRQTRDDAQYCFVPVDFSTDGFKQKYPDANTAGFETLKSWANISGWYTDDHVRVAEYWVKKSVKRKLALTPDGKIIDLETAKPEQMDILPPGTRVEERDSFKVCRYLISACEVLEGPEEWPGRHIPIVPLIGEEVRIGRKTIRKGIVRDAKGPQRMFNYFCAAHTEVVALQPKAPFMVTEDNVAKYQDVWETANRKNWPYLPYTPDSQNGGVAPQRVQPPVSSSGVLEGLAIANENLRRVIGIYDASLGAKSNETSGKAILARQREGDTGTYVYIDNFARSIRRTGEILIDLIPHIYDTERTIRIMGEDGKIDILKINQTALQAADQGLAERTLNDMTVGAYDVVAQVGPSYSTRREEAKEGMLAFTQANPGVAPLITDLVAKAQDWPMADDIAKRVRATLPPGILAMEEAEKQGLPPEQAQEAAKQAMQPPPDPKVMQAEAQIQIEQQKMQIEQQNAAANLELQAQKLRAETALAEQKLQAEIALKREEMQAKVMLEQERFRLEAEMKARQFQVDSEFRKQDLEARSKERAKAVKDKKAA